MVYYYYYYIIMNVYKSMKTSMNHRRYADHSFNEIHLNHLFMLISHSTVMYGNFKLEIQEYLFYILCRY